MRVDAAPLKAQALKRLLGVWGLVLAMAAPSWAATWYAYPQMSSTISVKLENQANFTPANTIVEVAEGTKIMLQLDGQDTDYNNITVNGHNQSTQNTSFGYSWQLPGNQQAGVDTGRKSVDYQAPAYKDPAAGQYPVGQNDYTITGTLVDTGTVPQGDDGQVRDVDVVISFIIRVTKGHVRQWRSNPPINDVVQTPAAAVSVGPGQSQNLSIGQSGDQDEYSEDGGQTWPGSEGQNVTYSWSQTPAGVGDFVNGIDEPINKPPSGLNALSARWKARPTTVARTVTITCTIDDIQDGTPGRDDAHRDKSFTINVTGNPPPPPVPTATPRPTATPTPVNPVATYTGSTRACAGGVLNNELHELWFLLSVRNSTNGQALANQEITFRLENNPGADVESDAHGRKAMIIKTALRSVQYNESSLASEWTTRTNAAGGFILGILSSQLISDPAHPPVLTVLCAGKQALLRASGSPSLQSNIPLNFVAAEGKRRYGILEFDQGYSKDTGFDFSPQVFSKPGDVVAVKYLQKFWTLDSRASIDQNYFTRNTDGHPVPSIDNAPADRFYSQAELSATDPAGHKVRPASSLTDSDKWVPVSGHKVRVLINRILDEKGTAIYTAPTSPALPTTGPPSGLAFFCDSTGWPVDFNGNRVGNPNNFTPPASIPVQAGMVQRIQGGQATFYIRAGNGITSTPGGQVLNYTFQVVRFPHTIELRVIDYSQRK